MERETKRGRVKVAAPSPGTSACYDSQIAQVSQIFNRTAAWRIDDVASPNRNAFTVLLFLSAVSRQRRAPAATLD